MLTPLAYESVRLFAEKGLDPPQIAEATGQQWLKVRDLLNIQCSGNRAKAKKLIDQEVPPTREDIEAAIAQARAKLPQESPLTAPMPRVGGRSAKPEPLPARLREEPVPAERSDIAITISGNPDQVLEGVALVAGATKGRPPGALTVNVDDLDFLDAVASAGHGHPGLALKVAKACELLAEVRRDLIAERHKTAAADRIAELKAEIARLEEWVK